MQAFGLELLERQDNLQRGEDRVRRDRYALVSSGWVPPEEVFPEWYQQQQTATWTEDTPEDILDQADVEYDYSGVTWQGPSDIEADELELLQQMMGENEHVQVGGD